MGRRWIAKEEDALAEIRKRMKHELSSCPQFPEGDRRLIRFLRGKGYDVDDTIKCISLFLQWRKQNKVDDIRQDIVYGKKNTPYDFPFGKTIIDLAPQIVISAKSIDKKGQPLALECYDFSPKDVLDAITIQDYLVFLTYTLEYRALVMEQMSHHQEQQYLMSHPDPANRDDGYGVVLLDFTIRDLKGVGLGHLGTRGRALVAAALNLGLPNYQEYLGKCHMINAPWLFTAFWYFVKGFLDQETIAKINFCGSNYMPILLADIPYECIPVSLGGGFQLYNEEFEFDLSVEGPLHYPEAPPLPPTTIVVTTKTITTSVEVGNEMKGSVPISTISNLLPPSQSLLPSLPSKPSNKGAVKQGFHLISPFLFYRQFLLALVLLIGLCVTILSYTTLENVAKLFALPTMIVFFISYFEILPLTF